MRSYQPYQQATANQILETNPEQLILMLFEGVLTHIKRAKERYIAGQIVSCKESISRVMRIVDCLSGSLNMEQGGEIAKNLEQLYYFCISRLYEADKAENPSQYLDEVERIILIIHKSWKQITTGQE